MCDGPSGLLRSKSATNVPWLILAGRLPPAAQSPWPDMAASTPGEWPSTNSRTAWAKSNQALDGRAAAMRGPGPSRLRGNVS